MAIGWSCWHRLTPVIVTVISPDNSRRDISLSGNEVINATVSDDGKRLYVITDGAGGETLHIIDTETITTIGEATLPDYNGDKVDMDLSADGTKLYITGARKNSEQSYPDRIDATIASVLVIDTTKFSVSSEPEQPPPAYSPSTPSSIKGLFDNIDPMTKNTAEGVGIQFSDAYLDGAIIVYFGGTQPCSTTCTNQSPLENSPSYFRQVKSEQTAIIDAALEKAPGASIILVGFSQGGMDAQNIAASGRYNVAGVITFGSPIVQPPSQYYYTLHLWDTRDNIPMLTDISYNIWPVNFHQDAIDAHQLFTFRSSTYDPGVAIPLTDEWWSVHMDPKTYEEVSDAFVAQVGSDEYQEQAYGKIRSYLDATLLTIPDGFFYADGMLMPEI